jgi:histidinol-phosphate aminotransferase|tara:strand:+ start:1282 stop:2274 length:993 start_codon:yes stop_codon:yes gene_type:complete
MNKIKRKFHTSVPHKKLRLHSAERNTPWGVIFGMYKKSLKEEDIRFYPNVDELKNPLSKFYGYDNFLMGFGSDRCINYFFEAHKKKHWLWGKKRLIISDPSFPMYDVYGQMHDYNIKKIGYNIIKFPIVEFLHEIDNNSVIVISNPSSPIGDVICREDIIKILNLGQPTLVDEAYIEFSNEESCINLVDEYPNLYVTRTFSKAYGSAGTRFGCIFSQKQNIENLTQYRDMYEISGQTFKWVQTLCKHKDFADEYIENVKKTRSELLIKLYDKDIKFIPSACNWFHVKESDLGKLPDNIVFRKNCIIPERGDDWVRLGITDNIKDYDWILK